MSIRCSPEAEELGLDEDAEIACACSVCNFQDEEDEEFLDEIHQFELASQNATDNQERGHMNGDEASTADENEEDDSELGSD